MDKQLGNNAHYSSRGVGVAQYWVYQHYCALLYDVLTVWPGCVLYYYAGICMSVYM